MKKLLLVLLMLTSANAKWIPVKDTEHLTILNDDTGEVFQEFLGTMVRMKFTDDVKIIYDENNQPIKVLPSDNKRDTPNNKK